MAIRLDGKKLAKELELRLQQDISNGLLIAGRPPGLAVIRVGNDPASEVYVSNKEKACSRIGIKSFVFHLPEDSSEKDLKEKIQELNENLLVDGILLQLPLPKKIDERNILKEIDPYKDADGLHTFNLGKLLKGETGPRSCTPAGVMALLARNKISIEGKRAVVIGRSILVGQPMALMLQASNATVTIAHSRTKDLVELTRQADVLVVAAGKRNIIGKSHIKENSVVVDVGIHRVINEKDRSSLCGDVRFNEVEPLVSAITPVPGGVGPMTVTMLLVNSVRLWQDHCGLSSTLDDLLP
tara:strand:- start:2601 stop:3494 length:894 start_codon:yes stop_codon:yes gene_type:complete